MGSLRYYMIIHLKGLLPIWHWQVKLMLKCLKDYWQLTNRHLVYTEEIYMTKHRGLGKGLQDMGLTELLSSINQPSQQGVIGQLVQADLDSLIPGKYQPRQQFDEESLLELSQSIKSQGIIQPLIVRLAGVNKYEIIAGERRWRASKLAGLKKVPVVIKEIDNEAAMAMGLIENMQREDLNAIDLAQGIDRLINEFSLTHQSIADILGKSRTSVTNTLRLLQLDIDLQGLVKDNQIEMGHARSLLSLPSDARISAAEAIIAKKLSVRATEDFIRNYRAGGQSSGLVKKV
ncbi:MAG: ParB/RepB/Spo0J family partition protein, partial [Legionellales bacterium]|nr:ParB/RepB/Spo0J family partition protein [Legionellales bacterium]